ncbi:MAG TPA: protoporphyrinogen oxidase [Anaerolineales bacterium]|nr:protoporphyrinogen oxidase [Anaerolineales bacterium]
MKRIVIIGGGIGGLSAAYYAKKKAPGARITLLEADSRWGGKITTDRVALDDGQFIIEGGPDILLATKPWGIALCKELGLSERLHGTNPHQNNTYILRKGHLLPLPDGLAMMIPTKVSAILRSQLISWCGKARMGLDFLLPAKAINGDESLGAFIGRRFGREAYESLTEPLMSGIYAGDGDQLSLASTFPDLRDLEIKYGSLARGALQIRKQSNGKAIQGSRSAFLTPTTGLAEIVEALVSYLKEHDADLQLNTRVVTIARRTPDTWNITLDTGETLIADGIIMAAPAFAAAQILASFDSTLANDLKSIPYASTATVSLAYRQSDLTRELDGYGYVIPHREGRKALACTWTSTKFPHRAPVGYALLRVFIGRAGQNIPWNKNDLLALAKEELRLTLSITAEPLLHRVFMWENAMPQYNLGHPEILKRIDATLRNHPGLALAGNGYRGIGIPDCIHSGELAVNKILENRQVEGSSVPTHTTL